MDPPCAAAELATLEKPDKLIEATLQLIKVGDLTKGSGGVENPKRSWLWQFNQMQKVVDRTGSTLAWFQVVFDNCTMGVSAARAKR